MSNQGAVRFRGHAMSNHSPTVSLVELLRLERRKVKVEPEQVYKEIGIYCFGWGIFHKTSRTGFEVGDILDRAFKGEL